ncbi:MAG: homeostatic response regulator transcription factor HsrA [Epsilonproteobacteria bacterium]|nr:homeostatic response regulator transcription factor HsrA [Campylobacterota bacterium]
MRFLIVEKDATLNKMIQKALDEYNYKSDEVLSIPDAKYYTKVRHYDLIIIDYNLNKEEVKEFIKNIRISFPITKIIVLGDDDSVETQIEVLNSGADDYITKPIHFGLLIAKIEANIRFTNTKQITIKNLVISPENEQIMYKDQVIELKGKPFEVFTYLAKHPDQVISKEQLLDSIWEEPEMVTPNVVEVAINQIRQKVDKYLGIITIETIRRRGYKFALKE